MKNGMMAPPMARPTGEAGVSMISKAAGRNSSSSRRQRRLATGSTGPMADSDDFMEARLSAMQHGIAPALPDEVVVTAILDDLAALDGDDAVGQTPRGEPVGDDQDRPAGTDLAHVLLDDSLALVVERAGGLVEDQDPWAGSKRSRDGNALTLTAREQDAPIADRRVIALRQLEDELVRSRQGGGFDDALHRHCRVGERDVVADRPVEEEILLENDADLTSQPRDVDHREIDAVDQDPPALWHVETLDELGDRRFARARRADNPDDLPGRDSEVDLMQHVRAIGAIAEEHTFERHLPDDRRQGGAGRVVSRLGMGIENVAQPGDR